MNADIKLMITLAGNQRLPHYEAAIFADLELTCFYLNTLCKDNEWICPCNTKADFDFVRVTCWYARRVIKGRWPEAETLIASDPGHVHKYAYHFIK